MSGCSGFDHAEYFWEGMSADIEPPPRSPQPHRLARLLEHPAIWRGRSAARTEVLPTGFVAFDDCLPGGGWPRTGLTEVLVPRFGVGELYLVLPALAAVSRRAGARWCVWISPPLEPFAPALAAHGVALENVLVVRATHERTTAGGRGGVAQPHAGRTRQRTSPQRSREARAPRDSSASWAFEQTLGSGACDMALAWLPAPRPREVRRLQLAAERGRALGVLFRPLSAAQESSPAVLRVLIEPVRSDIAGARVTLLKSRGGKRGPIELSWQG